jgi:hypothetical protein
VTRPRSPAGSDAGTAAWARAASRASATAPPPKTRRICASLILATRKPPVGLSVVGTPPAAIWRRTAVTVAGAAPKRRFSAATER